MPLPEAHGMQQEAADQRVNQDDDRNDHDDNDDNADNNDNNDNAEAHATGGS